MAPGLEPAHMRERHRKADRAVAAHAEIADIVEEDHAGGAGLIVRLAQKRADQRIVAARLVDGEAAVVVEVVERSARAFRPAGLRPAAARHPG